MAINPVRTVLLIENDLEQTRIIRAMFDDQGSHSFKLTRVECLADAEKYLAGHPVDIVLLDLGSSAPEGLEAVRRTRAVAPHASIVLLSSLDDEPKAIQAIQEGAQDYLIKGQIETHKLMRALGNAFERKMNEEILIDEKERAESTLNCIADAVICTDLSGNITFFNPVAGSTMGWPLNEVVGRPLTKAFRIVDATTREAILDPMAKAVSENLTGKLPSNCVLVHRDGHEVFIEDSVAPIHDREGKVTGAVIVFRDVSAERAQSEQLTHLAEHDSLTGLPNRLLFYDRVCQAISLAHRHGGQAAVLFLDLDGFKQVNDTLGHQIGDKLLRLVAKRTVACVRSSDTVSRLGGDEFVVLLPEVADAEDAAFAAEKILAAIAAPCAISGLDLGVSGCIGISIFPEDGQSSDTLIKSADTAMYQAKGKGPRTHQFFEKKFNVRDIERKFLARSSGRTLDRQQSL